MCISRNRSQNIAVGSFPIDRMTIWVVIAERSQFLTIYLNRRLFFAHSEVIIAMMQIFTK